MHASAPLRVPVELRQGSRWFRLARGVSIEALTLDHPVDDSLDGPVQLAFHLPGDKEPVRCHGKIEERVVRTAEESHAERSCIRFLDLSEEARTRIESYVLERMGLVS